MKQPQCELLGVTTVTGEPQKRASIVDALCRVAGRTDIPIHVGVEQPLLEHQMQPVAPHYEALSAWEHSEYTRENTATQFLIKSIRERPGEITLLTIGPLTNIALLFAVDPEIPRLLRNVVCMGGEFYNQDPTRRPEWNILCDPHAAAMVLAAPVDVTFVGLDVTNQCRLGQSETISRFYEAGGPLTVVADMAKIWFKGSEYAVFHDPLAAALIFEPELCNCVPSDVSLITNGTKPLGQTWATDVKQSRHRVAKSVNHALFFQHYFDIVTQS